MSLSRSIEGFENDSVISTRPIEKRLLGSDGNVLSNFFPIGRNLSVGSSL